MLQSQTTPARAATPGSCRQQLRIRLRQDFGRSTVTAIDQESEDVLSLTMQSPDGQPLPTALPGQYVVLRLQPAAGGPPLFRSYSLSGPPSTERYRISVKIEPNGAAGTYLREHVRVGDVARRQLAARKLHSAGRRAPGRAAQRGNRCDACSGDAARAGGSPLDATGLLAAREPAIGSIIHLPPKSAGLMLALAHGRSYVCYSRPGSRDRLA